MDSEEKVKSTVKNTANNNGGTASAVKNIPVLVLVLLAVLVLSIVVLLWQSGGDKTADTTNWQEYVNEQVGFTVKYPTDWTIQTEFTSENGGSQVLASVSFASPDYQAVDSGDVNGALINVRVDDIEMSGETYQSVEERLNANVESAIINSVKVGDLKAVEYSLGSGATNFVETQAELGNRAVFFTLVDNNADEGEDMLALYHDMAGTFEFTD